MNSPKATHTNYHELQVELDEVLARLQVNETEIDESVALYERGMQIIQDLQKYLKEAENKVSKIKAKFQDVA